MQPCQTRLWFYRLLVLLCAAVLGTSFYLQYGRGENPCILCLLQRFALILVLLPLLPLAIKAWSKLVSRLLQFSALLFSLSGTALATRQIWLQHSSDANLQCLPQLSYMLQHYPFLKTIELALHGSSDCAIVDATLFGISLATWSGIFFACLTIAILINLLIKKNQNNRYYQ